MARRSREALSGPHSLTQDTVLSLYYREIAGTRPLTSREEVALAVKIRRGDEQALRQLVVANLRFVVSVASTYQHQGVPLVDLISEGNLGLIQAAHRFDETKNFRFISYAVWWIRQAILRVLAQRSRFTRLPLNRAGCVHQIGQAQRKLEQRLRRSPSIEEIAVELRLSRRVVEQMLQVTARQSSLDAVSGITGHDMHDRLASTTHEEAEDALCEASLSEHVSRALDVLTAREQDVIRRYFGMDRDAPSTLDEVGGQLGITRERVRQIKEKAIAKLQQSESVECLRTYLDQA